MPCTHVRHLWRMRRSSRWQAMHCPAEVLGRVACCSAARHCRPPPGSAHALPCLNYASQAADKQRSSPPSASSQAALRLHKTLTEIEHRNSGFNSQKTTSSSRAMGCSGHLICTHLLRPVQDVHSSWLGNLESQGCHTWRSDSPRESTTVWCSRCGEIQGEKTT